MAIRHPRGTTPPITRRELLAVTATGATAAALAGPPPAAALAATHPPRRPVPLPSPAAVRADIRTMVGFGTRLPGYPGHDRFCSWLEQEFLT